MRCILSEGFILLRPDFSPLMVFGIVAFQPALRVLQQALFCLGMYGAERMDGRQQESDKIKKKTKRQTPCFKPLCEYHQIEAIHNSKRAAYAEFGFNLGNQTI